MWNKIELEVCQNLIESMPRRIAAIIKAKGAIPSTRHTCLDIFLYQQQNQVNVLLSQFSLYLAEVLMSSVD